MKRQVHRDKVVSGDNQIGKEAAEKMGVGTKSEAILRHLLYVLCKSLPERQVSISFTLKRMS